MNILFLTLFDIDNIEEYSLYTDVLREFRKNGHTVYVVSPNERRMGKPTELISSNDVHILKVKIGNMTKCGIIEKGISTLLIEGQYKRAIKKHLSDVKFDIIIYSTPPITLVNVVKYIKLRDGARSYLLLKDIFPQNAVDLGMLSKKGIGCVLYRYFRCKEKNLYKLSDKIGCMSPANRDYVIKHNPEIPSEKVEVCPNSIDVRDFLLSQEETVEMRRKYGIPLDKKVFIYGGNLGRPQGVSFIVECLKALEDNTDAYFLMVGSGTDSHILYSYINKHKPNHVKLMPLLPKEDYDRMVAACDVGLIFLDHRFTIPNFPSRLLSYMQAGIPVLACTDKSTDIGKIITENGFGWSCESNDKETFCKLVKSICENTDSFDEMRENELRYLREEYDSAKTYSIIIGE